MSKFKVGDLVTWTNTTDTWWGQILEVGRQDYFTEWIIRTGRSCSSRSTFRSYQPIPTQDQHCELANITSSQFSCLLNLI